MEYIHYFIVIPIILVIIILQINVFRETLSRIFSFKRIFPSNIMSYKVIQVQVETKEQPIETDLPIDEDDEEIWEREEYEGQEMGTRKTEISQIEIDGKSPTLSNIKDALNMYLEKNKGAVSDFSLMKDIVERYCGAEEEEIEVMQPIPLYMGLMGTMVGIIVGITLIAVQGGVDGENLNNVSSMMTCVAIAMVASFFGILFTTVISWRSKDAKTCIEANKNQFYSWLQTELLPVLSGNTATALSLLQSNLLKFNLTFQKNIQEFDTVLTSIKDVSTDQAEALKAINEIDIQQVAQVNIVVLKALQNSVSQIDRFNQYLLQVNDYIVAVNNLNANLSNHLNRTAAIERMGAFFERELSQFRSREEFIQQAVGEVDSTIEASFGQLITKMNKYVEEMQTLSKSELGAIKDAHAITMNSLVEELKKEQDDVAAKTNNLDELLKGIQTLAETKSSIDTLVSASKINNSKLDKIIKAIESVSNGVKSGSGVSPTHQKKTPLFNRILNLALPITALFAFILFLVDFIAKYF